MSQVTVTAVDREGNQSTCTATLMVDGALYPSDVLYPGLDVYPESG